MGAMIRYEKFLNYAFLTERCGDERDAD